MKYFLIFGLLFCCSGLSAQYKTLTLKSGNTFRYSKLYFVSDDSLFFKSKADKLDYKVATSDLTSKFYVPYGKYYQLATKSRNMQPLKVAMGVGLGLMLGGAGAAFLVDTDFVVIYAVAFASPGLLLFTITKTVYDTKKIHQRALPVN